MKPYILTMFIKLRAEGRNLFSNINGDEDTIMGLPVFKIKEYLKNYQ